MSVINLNKRKLILRMVCEGGDGHIPSAYSILEIITVLYKSILNVSKTAPKDKNRDIFILSKGHGCLALYVNLLEHGFITDEDIKKFCKHGGILGEHPDCNKIPGVEANTGSLGHGFPFAVGQALGYRIQNRSNRVFVLMGDGECQEGSIWEGANIAANQGLGNLCAMVDRNQSAIQLMPIEDLKARWESFGWIVIEADGHNENEIFNSIMKINFSGSKPTVIIFSTIKGYGAKMLEGHGKWHHKIPNEEEYKKINYELENY